MYILRTGSSGAIENITRFPKESEDRSPVVRHGRGGCIFFSRFLYAEFFSGYVLRSIVRRSACGDVSFKLSFYPFKTMYDMNIRSVVLGCRFKFCLFPVFALQRRQTRTSWFHARRAWLSGIRCHGVVYGIGQFDNCEGTPLF